MKFSAIIFSCLFFLFSFFFFTPSVFANNTPASTNVESNVPNNLHNWTQNVMIEVMLSLTCQLVGVDPTTPDKQCLGVNQKTGKIGFLPAGNLAKGEVGGAIGGMNNMISMLYTPPLHTGDYFQNLAQNFGINKKAYAQSAGTGFQGLSPLIGIWSAFRNIVYLFLVIVFVVIGLAIMLRVKIDPRTVMTIQNQIPKIIIAILAVTFSFAIAGFLIDMMWVCIYLGYSILSEVPNLDVNSLSGLSPAVLQGKTPMGAVGGLGGITGITTNVGNSILGTVNDLLGLGLGDSGWANPIIHAISVGVGTYIGMATDGFTFLGNSILVDKIAAGISATAGLEAGIRWAVPWLVTFLIIFIALITALFRLWFTLIIAYVQILLAVVIAPFWIIGGIVPGSPVSLSGWLKNILANLLAFPVTIAMFMLGKIFMDSFKNVHAAPGTQNFVPPLIGNPGDPSLIGSLIGLGIILMTPNIINLLKSTIKVAKFDTGLGKAVSVGTGITGIPTKMGHIGLAISGMKQVPLLSRLPGLGGGAKPVH